MGVNGKTEVLSRGEKNIYIQKKDQTEIKELKDCYMKKKKLTEWAQQQNGDGEIRVSEFEIR